MKVPAALYQGQALPLVQQLQFCSRFMRARATLDLFLVPGAFLPRSGRSGADSSTPMCLDEKEILRLACVNRPFFFLRCKLNLSLRDVRFGRRYLESIRLARISPFRSSRRCSSHYRQASKASISRSQDEHRHLIPRRAPSSWRTIRTQQSSKSEFARRGVDRLRFKTGSHRSGTTTAVR